MSEVIASLWILIIVAAFVWCAKAIKRLFIRFAEKRKHKELDLIEDLIRRRND